MSLDRDDMLREMELLPVWKLRDSGVVKPEPVVSSLPTAAAQAVEAEIDTTVPVGVTEPAVFADNRLEQIEHMDWEALQACVKSCDACELAATRTQTVFGVGDPHAEWLMVGEAPGVEEDRKGEPFVGQAGKLLDNMLAAIKLARGKNVYIANTVKCRPPENRNPHADELQQCGPFLRRQVALIQPRLILALGKVAAQTLLDTDASIASLRGSLHDYHGVPVIVTYHPAYLLRNLPDKAKAWEDLCYARRIMQDLQSQAAV